MNEAGAPPRLAVVCEVMHAPFDEGIRIVAAGLARALGGERRLLLVSEKDSVLDEIPIHGALANRWFASAQLARLVRDFDPRAVLYIPWTSLTTRTLLRAAVLRRYARGAPVAVLALQPRPIGLSARAAARMCGRVKILAGGPGAQRQAERLGLAVHRVPAAVDTGRFHPAPAAARETLRRRAEIPPGAFVVLHVGHLKESRGVGVLARIARLDGVICLMAASSSTGVESPLAERLSRAGVILMTHHQERIERAYQMADAYVFPVTSPLDAIEAPLSVLEAAACDLAIVSTRFGALPDLLGAGRPAPGVVWAEGEDAMVEAVSTLAERRVAGEGYGTRRLVMPLTWKAASESVLAALGLRDGERSAPEPAEGEAG